MNIKDNPIYKAKENIRSITVRSQYMQVLIESLQLKRLHRDGVSLELEITDDSYYIGNSLGKRELYDAIQETDPKLREQVTQKLDNFFKDPNLLGYRLDTSAFPFRYANGGVLPIIHIGDKDYFCLFYRERNPIGWNIANGGSNDIREILNPEKIIFREFGEEFFMIDKEQQILYYFDPSIYQVTKGAQQVSLDLWNKKFTDLDLTKFKKLPIALKWIYGNDIVTVKYKDEYHKTKNCFVSINKEDNSIELDRIVRINLKDSVLVFDGEVIRDELVNRIVGLFEVETFKTKLKGKEFRPDRIFYAGREYPANEMNDLLFEDFIKIRKPNTLDRDVKFFEEAKYKFNLCPVTRSIINKYYQWETQEQEQLEQKLKRETVSPIQHVDSKLEAETDIFISFNHNDEKYARWLYEFLINTKENYKVFFSAESIRKQGESHYCRAIDKALDSSRCLIVVGTDPKHFESEWVYWEWRTFLNDKISGHKDEKKLFTFADNENVKPQQLPIALRDIQMIPFGQYNISDALNNMYRYVRNALT